MMGPEALGLTQLEGGSMPNVTAPGMSAFATSSDR
jgi:hypothetical protein